MTPSDNLESFGWNDKAYDLWVGRVIHAQHVRQNWHHINAIDVLANTYAPRFKENKNGNYHIPLLWVETDVDREFEMIARNIAMELLGIDLAVLDAFGDLAKNIRKGAAH